MAVRRLLWWLAAGLLVLAALVAYSPNPNLNRHSNPAALLGLACFFAGWAVGPAAAID